MSSSPLSPLYSRYLTPAEKRSLRRVPVEDVSSEINLLRVLNALLMQIQQAAPPGIHPCIQALRTCVILNHQLAYLARWHDRTHGPLDEMEAAIQAVLESTADEWKLA